MRFSQAEAHDVPDDQEVAGEIELLDHRELLLDLGLGLRRQRTEAGARAVPGDLAQKRRRRLAGRQRIVGKSVAQVREREVEALRELARAVEGLRDVREELRHLGRALEVPLALGGEDPARAVERRVVADARHHVVELLVLLARVANAVRGEERKPQASREVDECRVAPLLFAQMVPLQLDVQPPGEDPGEPLEQRPRRVEAALPKRPRHWRLVPARRRVEPLRVRGHLLERHRRLALRLPERAGGDEPAEILVARAVLDEEREARKGGRKGRPYVSTLVGAGLAPALQSHLRPHQRPDARRLRRFPEPRRAVDAVALDEGDGRDLEPRGLFDEVLRQRRGVQKREGRSRAHLDVLSGTRRRTRGELQRGAGKVALPELLLARARRDDQLQGIGGLVSPAAARIAHTEIARGRHLGRAVRRPALLGHARTIGVRKA